jgi:hypothetical protein
MKIRPKKENFGYPCNRGDGRRFLRHSEQTYRETFLPSRWFFAVPSPAQPTLGHWDLFSCWLPLRFPRVCFRCRRTVARHGSSPGARTRMWLTFAPFDRLGLPLSEFLHQVSVWLGTKLISGSLSPTIISPLDSAEIKVFTSKCPVLLVQARTSAVYKQIVHRKGIQVSQCLVSVNLQKGICSSEAANPGTF